MDNTAREAAEVLAFWLGEIRPDQWFKKDADLDETIRARFGPLYRRLAAGLAPRWLETPESCLAAVIVLDQFPRNMFRDDARAYATDAAALAIAEHAIANRFDRELTPAGARFLYTPFEHSEDAAMQARSVALFATASDAETMKYIERHQEIIDRFGRFPHRNATLGRPSTAEERAFLEEPDSSF
jgi:uncharacterized protein (DUF924 family)